MKLKFEWDWAGTHYFVTNSKKEWLGDIYWFPDWKCWVWEQKQKIIMSEKCLFEVYKFIKDAEKKYPKSLMMKRNKIMEKQAKEWVEGQKNG